MVSYGSEIVEMKNGQHHDGSEVEIRLNWVDPNVPVSMAVLVSEALADWQSKIGS